MSLPSHLPKLLMLATAGLQGLGVSLLYRSFDEGLWPSQSPMWFYPMISLVLLLPTGFLLTVEQARVRLALLLVGAYGIIVGLLGAYIGYQAMPFGEVRIDGLSVTYAITLGIASFITLIFVQRQVAEALGYEPLFLFSWRNLVVGALSLAFLGGVILMYLLWAALFNEIGIGFFKELFAFGQRLDSRGKSPSFQSLSQNFRSHNTCSDGLTGTAANWLEPGYFSQGEKSVVILPNLGRKDLDTELEAKVVAGIPMGRRALPEDVADAFVYLASDEASFVTGIALDVDGGRLLS